MVVSCHYSFSISFETGLLLLGGDGFFLAPIATDCQPSAATMPWRVAIYTPQTEKKTGIRNDVPNARITKLSEGVTTKLTAESPLH